MDVQALGEMVDMVQRLSLAVHELQTQKQAHSQCSLTPAIISCNDQGSRCNEKISLPLPFSGKRGSEILTFTSKLRRIFRSNNTNFQNELAKVDFIANLLEERAHKWFINHEKLASEFTKNSQDLLYTLDQIFGDSDEIEKATLEIQILKQKGSVADFIFKFEELQILTEFNEAALFSFFKKGLKDSVLDALALSLDQPKNLKSLQEFAQRLDNQIFRRNAEKNNNFRQLLLPTDNQHESSMIVDAVQPIPSVSSSQLKRLSPEERERRIQNKLCIICGRPGHFRNNCHLNRNSDFHNGHR